MGKIYELSEFMSSKEVDEDDIREYICYNCEECITDVPANILYKDAYDNHYREATECVYAMLAECYTIEITDVRSE